VVGTDVMLQALAFTLAATGAALLAWHWKGLHCWVRNQRALALLPHPPPEHWLWGNAQALDFHRKMLDLTTQLGGVFSMRLIWFKASQASTRAGCPLHAAARLSALACAVTQVVILCDPHLVSAVLSRESALDKPFACKAFAEGYFPISVVRRGAVRPRRLCHHRVGWVLPDVAAGSADQQPSQAAQPADAEQQVAAVAACAQGHRAGVLSAKHEASTSSRPCACSCSRHDSSRSAGMPVLLHCYGQTTRPVAQDRIWQRCRGGRRARGRAARRGLRSSARHGRPVPERVPGSHWPHRLRHTFRRAAVSSERAAREATWRCW